MNVGVHVLGNLYGCPNELLEKVDVVRSILWRATIEARFTAVGESFHQFEPAGVTGVILLSESHMSIHTWPEKNFAAVDIFTCGEEGNAEEGFDLLCSFLKPQRIEKSIIRR
ncbi:MAG: adenosylmethionine decarboxylase [Spirochaetales bacterium]|nr:MAG: adenosylmethionine decarboxylase [Spirochaetales bacterium]